MKKLILFLAAFFGVVAVWAQDKYWQQEVNFTINVSLNDKEHSLDALETIEYVNNSPDTLKYIWFHLWPNAYKNDRTSFSEQMLKERRTDFYFSNQQQKGYINQVDFKVDNNTAIAIPDSANIDIVKVLLPQPLPPAKKVVITTPFKVKLPQYFSRGGHIGNNYMVTQWFPKPAVYDNKGWHPIPYLDQGEFYSEFGSYDVEITAPSAYLIAATGVLQDAETLNQIKQNGKHTVEGITKTWHFKQSNIHDFAWFASKAYTAHHDTTMLPSGKIVDVFSYYKPNSKSWNASVSYIKDGLKKYSSWIGDYPYSVASVVQGFENVNSGGMEYPTITLITTQQGGRMLDATIVHEVGHNWFYGALGSNERDFPWMDEGMNTYYQKRYEKEKYESAKRKPVPFAEKFPKDEEAMLLSTIENLHKDQPINTGSVEESNVNYIFNNYVKTPLWLSKLEQDLGRENFDKGMQLYYQRWKFQHPYPADFRKSIEDGSKRNVEAVFNILNRTGKIDSNIKKTIKPAILFNLNNTDKYNYVSIAPVGGYNYYDKFMIGGMIHNYQLPLPKLQFIGGLMYATGSKNTNGFGRISYNIYRRRYNVSTALSYITYSIDDYKVDEKNKLYLRMERLVPSINFTFFDKDPLSTRRFHAGFKTFLLTEGNLNFTTVTTPDTIDVVNVVNKRSYINRLSFGVSDNRVLFPYSVNLTADQGKEFVRTGLTAKYFFNYPDGKTGMSVRFFAGKFFYLKSKTITTRYNNDRYLLNLSAPKGYEDYTYSDYFFGRNEFEGWRSQQVMERDGFFKVNTELLSDKVGKTDDWLMAMNFSTGLPEKINPLSILPIKIPLKIFADVGTYAEAWKNNPASGRFVYDAGLQISLFESLLEIYVPVLYSKVYKDYYKSTISEKRFLKTITFNVNLNKISIREFVKEVPF